MKDYLFGRITMTEHNAKKILNLNAVATLTTAAGVAVANGTAHADTVASDAPQTQQQQTPQEQYQAAQKSADQKINDQANANKAKEDALAKQNEADMQLTHKRLMTRLIRFKTKSIRKTRT